MLLTPISATEMYSYINNCKPKLYRDELDISLI